MRSERWRGFIGFLQAISVVSVFVLVFSVLLGSVAHSTPTGRRLVVAPGQGPWFQSIQGAINAASSDPANPDTIYVYSNFGSGYEENLLINKPVSLIGVGGATTITVTSNSRRVLTIDGRNSTINTNTVISGFTFTGGNATYDSSIDDDTLPDDIVPGCGGGVLIIGASPTLSANIIENNTASSINAEGRGGGVCLQQSSAVLNANTIRTNKAATASGSLGRGGGVYAEGGAPILLNNSINSNLASEAGEGRGGGVYLNATAATVKENAIAGNRAAATGAGFGGGMYVTNAPGASTLRVVNNGISTNTASTNGSGRGGGMYLEQVTSQLDENVVQGNTASGAATGRGGGIFINRGSPTIADHSIIFNNVTNSGNGGGGGVWLQESSARLTSNVITDNYECGVDTFRSSAIRIEDSSGWLFISNLVAQNRPYYDQGLGCGGENYVGAAIQINNGSGRMLHTTISDNGEFEPVEPGFPPINQTGVELVGVSNVALVNTIISGHETGVKATGSQARANLSHTLFFDNGQNTLIAEGAVIESVAEAPVGNPAFLNVDSYPLIDYHIGATSAARDRGTPTEATRDIDGDQRAVGAPDLGADEFIQGFRLQVAATPDTLKAGEPYTITINYTLNYTDSVSGVTLSATLPEGATNPAPSKGGAISGTTANWNLGTIQANTNGGTTLRLVAPNNPQGMQMSTVRITSALFTAETSIAIPVQAGGGPERFRVYLPSTVR
jgi:hypothetical protein